MALEYYQDDLDFSVINTEMTVEAMRDSGYKSTTHALSELIDNAIEASASTIEIFGLSGRDDTTGRITLKELAVLDNGEGMNKETLRNSLRYGHGTRRSRHGIGRFGVGLPNSSMSQARRVDIWSWKTGVTNALHTWLSIDDVERGLKQIPEPTLKPIPAAYISASLEGFTASGTIVVWTDLDRVEWKRAATTFRHTEALLGRIYRRFLATPTERLHVDDDRHEEIGQQRTIACVPIEDNGISKDVRLDDVVWIRPNDPLYLMRGTTCPEAFGPGPMFTELESSPFDVPITYNGKTYMVRVRATYAQPHARHPDAVDASWPSEWTGRDAGHTPWGKHADHNMGISMVRAHREIAMDPSWTNGADPTERWWTVEIDFPTQLDEVFGVTNNKQGTMTFERLAHFDWRREALPGEETAGDVRRRMEADGDHRVNLWRLREQISRAITALRGRIKQSKQRRKRHDLDEDQKADAKASEAIRRRIEEGKTGESDSAKDQGNESDHSAAQVASLVERHHFTEEDAFERVRETFEANNLVRWIQSAQASPAFFDVEPLPGVLQVALNVNHPVHSHLYELMHPDIENLSDTEIRERLDKAAAAFRILIYSWARFEEEQKDRDRRQVRNARLEWGKSAEEFFDVDDSSIPPTDMV